MVLSKVEFVFDMAKARIVTVYITDEHTNETIAFTMLSLMLQIKLTSVKKSNYILMIRETDHYVKI